jgi:hypothetical protein
MNVEAPFHDAGAPPTVSVALHAAGDGLNLVGNPFRADIDVSDLAGWASGGVLSSAVGQAWDPGTSSWQLATRADHRLAAWSGLMVENSTASSLEVPASAQIDSAAAAGGGGPETRVLAFELEGTSAEGVPLADRGAALFFHPDAGEEWDVWDASELTPLAPAYASLSFEGTRGTSPILKAQESRAFWPEEPFDLPMDFVAVGTAPSFTLRWPDMTNIPEPWGLVLQDLVTGASVDLRAAREYAFAATPLAPPDGTPAGRAPALSRLHGGSARFVLHVNPEVPTTNAPDAAPTAFALGAPTPNPTAGYASVSFDVPSAASVSIDVFDLLGRRVLTLVDGRFPAGRHLARMDAGSVSAGVYVVAMRAGDFAATRRIVVDGRAR